MKDLANKKLLKEWKKIETANIFSNLEEFADFYYANGEKSCFRIITSEPWSKDNFFFGDYSELLNYYKNEFPKRRIGQKFHSLTILDVFYKNVNGKELLYAKCRCDCGNETEKLLEYILKGNARTCGCKEGQGCRKIGREKLSKDVIDEYWDYEKNTVNPETIEQRSKEKFWFKDKEGHSYKLAPYTYAKNETATSFPEQSVYYYVKKFFPDTVNKAQYVTKDGEVLEIDIFIPSLNIAIEYDGLYWHENRLNGDNEKNKALNEDGLYVIRIRESGLPTLDAFNGITIIRGNPLNKDESLIDSINKTLLKLKNISQKNIIKIKEERFDKDKLSILSFIYNVPKEDNLLNYNFNSVWDYKNNGNLKPECIDFSFPYSLNFKCKYGFKTCAIPKNMAKRVKIETKTCPLSCYCIVDYKEPCEYYVQDYLYQKIKSGRRKYLARAACRIREETFLNFVFNTNSIIYNGFPIEKSLKFALFSSFEYKYSVFKKVLNFILSNEKFNINFIEFFKYIYEELEIDELVVLLNEKDLYGNIIDFFSKETCCDIIEKEFKFCGYSKFYYLAQFLHKVSNKFSDYDLVDIFHKLKITNNEMAFSFFIAELKNLKGNVRICNVLKTSHLDVFDNSILYFDHLLKNSSNIRRDIISLQKTSQAQFIYYLYKNKRLNKLVFYHETLRRNDVFIPQNLDLSYIANKNEIKEIYDILNKLKPQSYSVPLSLDIDIKFQEKDEGCENSIVSKLNTFGRSVERATDKLNVPTNDFADLCGPKKEKKKTDKKKPKEKAFGIIWLILKWIFYIFWEVFNFLFLVLLFIIGFLDGLFFHKIRMQGVYKRAAQKAAATRKRNAPYKNSKRPRAYNLK